MSDRQSDTGVAGAGGNPLLQDWTAPFGLPPFGADAGRRISSRPSWRRCSASATSCRPSLPRPPRPTSTTPWPPSTAAGACSARIGVGVLQPDGVAHERRAAGRAARAWPAPLAAHDSAVYMRCRRCSRASMRLHEQRATLGLGSRAAAPARARAPGLRARRRAPAGPGAPARYAQVMEELAALTTRFAQNVLHDESSWHLALRRRGRPGRPAGFPACGGAPGGRATAACPGRP